MSGPNPFSSSNAPQHNLVSKVKNTVGNPYAVAVDLVDIDTAYIRQLGSTSAPVQQAYITQIGSSGSSGAAYFKDIYWQTFHPALPFGITGPTGPAGASVVGGTGINIVTAGSTSTISNTGLLGVTGSQYISINTTNPQNPSVVYIGPTGTVRSVTGSTGISVNNTDPANPVVANTGILEIFAGTNVNVDITDPQRPIINAAGGGGGVPGGPTGEIVFFTATGVDSRSILKYDGTALNSPPINISSSTGAGKLNLGITGNNSVIGSGAGGNGSGNLLEIGPIGSGTTGVYSTLTVDTINSRLGINTVPTVELDVLGQTLLTGTEVEVNLAGGSGTSGTFALSPNTSYTVYAWGAGGRGNGGTGGAGGFSQVEITTGLAAQSLSWSQLYGGESGGGNATVISYAGTPFIYVPGGGAGVTGGTGAAAGELQGRPIPEGGMSAYGSEASSFAAYNISQSWSFSTVAGAVLPANEVFTGGTINGRSVLLSSTAGITLDFNYAGVVNPIIQTTTSSGTTYTVPPGITLTINSNNVVFSGATFTSLPNITTALPNGSYIAVDAGTSGTGGTGTAVYSGWPGVTLPNQFNGAQINTGATGISVGSGNVTWNSGNLVVGATGTTYSYFFTPGNVVTNTPSNHVIILANSSTLTLPYVLPGITGSVITTSNPNQALPVGTQITVAGSRVISYGRDTLGSTGVGYGGGGYRGGGNSALITTLPQGAVLVPGTSENEPAGGGAGAFFVQTSSLPDSLDVQPEFDIGGSGLVPYVNRFNPNGFYGRGGMTGNPGYVVITQVISAPNALHVIGSELIEAGDLEVRNGDIYTDQGIEASFLSATAYGTAPAGGVTNGIPTQSGGKMMWNSIAPGTGRTELLNAVGSGPSGNGFAFYTGPDGATAQAPTGNIRNLGFWDLAALVLQTPLIAQNLVTLGSTTLAAFNSTGNSQLSGSASLSVGGGLSVNGGASVGGNLNVGGSISGNNIGGNGFTFRIGNIRVQCAYITTGSGNPIPVNFSPPFNSVPVVVVSFASTDNSNVNEGQSPPRVRAITASSCNIACQGSTAVCYIAIGVN